MKKFYKISSLLFVVLACNLINVNAGVAADSISVTLYCDLRGSAIENNPVLYVTGSFSNPGGNWNFKTMTLVQPNIWMVTIKYLPGSLAQDTTDYYFASANDWSEPSREVVPAPCNRSWGTQRTFMFDITKPDSAVAFKWGQCEAYNPSDLLTGIKIPNTQNKLIYTVTLSGDLRILIPSQYNKANVELLNLSGIAIRKTRTTESEATIPVSDLPKGIYVLKVSDNQKTVAKKIILK